MALLLTHETIRERESKREMEAQPSAAILPRIQEDSWRENLKLLIAISPISPISPWGRESSSLVQEEKFERSSLFSSILFSLNHFVLKSRLWSDFTQGTSQVMERSCSYLHAQNNTPSSGVSSSYLSPKVLEKNQNRTLVKLTPQEQGYGLVGNAPIFHLRVPTSDFWL